MVQFQRSRLETGNERIAVGDFGAHPRQQGGNVKRGRLPGVRDVPLVRDSDEMDPAAADGLGKVVQGGLYPANDVTRHAAVDLGS